MPWALTKHIDVYRNINDPIETVLFIDGLKRVLQTKKDMAINTAGTNTATDKMVASGRLTFDFVGRTTERRYPVEENLGSQGVFNAAIDPEPPTITEFDVLDRTTKLTTPHDTPTRMTTFSYGFGADRNGQQQFLTTVVDANGIPRETYRDVRGVITTVKAFNNGGAQILQTSYDYDPLKQITLVKDDHGNDTTAAYDNFGRRISLNSPDMGLTEWVYDLASNVTGKITANLRAAGQQISYDYTFLRLNTITYPQFTENNVAYTYGAPGAAFNRANRIVTVTDESGLTEREYGPLGEVVKETRTINSDTKGNSKNSPEVHTTAFTFDTWNRLQSLIYPDGEVLDFDYDSGGLVEHIDGVKAGNNYAYLNFMGYDKFGQRTRVAYGNATTMDYTYDNEDRRLATLNSDKTGGRNFMALSYGYDEVGNVLSMANGTPVPTDDLKGGPTSYNYTYDDLYRLTDATGNYKEGAGHTHEYTLAMAYDTIHNITGKTQAHNRITPPPDNSVIPQHKTTYDWSYDYGS